MHLTLIKALPIKPPLQPPSLHLPDCLPFFPPQCTLKAKTIISFMTDYVFSTWWVNIAFYKWSVSILNLQIDPLGWKAISAERTQSQGCVWLNGGNLIPAIFHVCYQNTLWGTKWVQRGTKARYAAELTNKEFQPVRTKDYCTHWFHLTFTWKWARHKLIGCNKAMTIKKKEAFTHRCPQNTWAHSAFVIKPNKSRCLFSKKAKFSCCLSEVKFQFYFMHAAIIWYPRGREGTGSVD